MIRDVPWRFSRLPAALHDRFADAGTGLLHKLHNLSQAHVLMRLASVGKVDVVAALRADLRYLDDLDMDQIAALIGRSEADLITPDWQNRGGLNDRFAFMAPGAREAGPGAAP